MDQANAEITVGMLDLQQAFQTYPGSREMIQRLRDLQGQAQQAQQQGDQEQLIKLQMTMQQEQRQFVDKFQKDVDDAMPKVAEDSGVDLIVRTGGIVYQKKSVATKDVTDAVIEALGGEPMTQPQMGPSTQPQQDGQSQTEPQTDNGNEQHEQQ